MVIFLDKWDQVRVAVTGNDKHLLVGVLGQIRVSQDVQQAPRLNGNHHVLE
jgi:hypothetical protein